MIGDISNDLFFHNAVTNNFPSNHNSKFHQKELQRHCRVCACIMEGHSRPQFDYHCQEQHNQSLLLNLGVSVIADPPDVHPTHFCHSCCTKASHHLETTTSSITQFVWKPHSSNRTACSLLWVRSRWR